MNEEMTLEMVCQFLTLVGFIFGLVSLKIEIDSLNTEAIVLSCIFDQTPHFPYRERSLKEKR